MLDETPPVSMDDHPRGVPLYEPACVLSRVSHSPLFPPSPFPTNVFPFDFVSNHHDSSHRHEYKNREIISFLLIFPPRVFASMIRVRRVRMRIFLLPIHESRLRTWRNGKIFVLHRKDAVSRVFGFSPSFSSTSKV